MSAIVNVIVGVHESNSNHPVPSLLGPVGISLIARVSGQSGAQIEEAAVCNAWGMIKIDTSLRRDRREGSHTVLVVITIIGKRNLPSQTTVARTIMP